MLGVGDVDPVADVQHLADVLRRGDITLEQLGEPQAHAVLFILAADDTTAIADLAREADAEAGDGGRTKA